MREFVRGFLHVAPEAPRCPAATLGDVAEVDVVSMVLGVPERRRLRVVACASLLAPVVSLCAVRDRCQAVPGIAEQVRYAVGSRAV